MIETASNTGVTSEHNAYNLMSLFLPYTKLSKDQIATKDNPKTVQVSVGTVIFENVLLDQTHQDIIQILLTFPKEFGLKLFYDPNGTERRSFEFTAYQMSKYLGTKHGNKEWVFKKLEEMATCTFTLFTKATESLKQENKVQVYSRVLFYAHENSAGKLEVEISPFFLEAYNFDTAIHTEKLTAELLKIEEGYNKALVHHCLTHSKRSFSLEMLMANIGLPTREENSVLYNRYRNYITKPENQEKLKKFGITFEQRNPFTPKVWHVNIDTSLLNGKVWTDNHQQLIYKEPLKATDKIEKLIKKS